MHVQLPLGTGIIINETIIPAVPSMVERLTSKGNAMGHVMLLSGWYTIAHTSTTPPVSVTS